MACRVRGRLLPTPDRMPENVAIHWTTRTVTIATTTNWSNHSAAYHMHCYSYRCFYRSSATDWKISYHRLIAWLIVLTHLVFFVGVLLLAFSPVCQHLICETNRFTNETRFISIRWSKVSKLCGKKGKFGITYFVRLFVRHQTMDMTYKHQNQ